MNTSGQKFVKRNRAPRVQIEYDVELYGSEKKVNLPFVGGVMADLSGNPKEPLEPMSQRGFKEVDIDNFDEFLKDTQPRVATRVPNTLTGEGEMSVDFTLESMDDFSPDHVAKKIDPLRKLIDARDQLSNLISYMDGKEGAENLIQNLLSDPDLMKSLSSVAKQTEDTEVTTADAPEAS